jgi:hypothetical protein
MVECCRHRPSSLFRDGSEKWSLESSLSRLTPSFAIMVTRLTCIGSSIRTYIAAVREEPNCYYQIPPLPNVTILLFSRHIVPLPSMSAVTTYNVDRWTITIHGIPRPEKSNPPPSPFPVGFRSPISLFRPFHSSDRGGRSCPAGSRSAEEGGLECDDLINKTHTNK